MDTQWAQKYLDILERDEIAQKMQAFYDLLVFYNEKFNLTRIIGREECRIKHFLDSICAETYFPAGANVAEIGSGAGFPSLPLKIVRDDLSFALVESVEKKCVFLREAVKELGLKNIQVIHMRAEEELREAENAFRVLGVKTVACERYDLPEEMGKRTLIVAEKIFSTPAAYPRGNGKERGKPL